MDWGAGELYRFVRSLSRNGIGPTMTEFNRARPPLKPTASAVCRHYDREENRYGWAYVLKACGLLSPPKHIGEITYPTIYGEWDKSRIQEVPLHGRTLNIRRYGGGYEEVE